MKKTVAVKKSHNHSNHLLLMALCCIAPILIAALAVYAFGLNRSYLAWAALIGCMLMHVFMIKGCHKEEEAGMNKNSKEQEKCH
ncbi:TPA: hypothetical protein HA361_01505 [Candidatus Woesearchaeota archaeon]|nr:hypothetical protein [Candidatus Woesearchaeota archaeon]HII68969.1 hypothetical protein [Candidatus Woesearchaeota archaeon]